MVHGQQCYCGHYYSSTAAIGGNIVVVLTGGQAAEGYSWAEACRTVCSRSSAGPVAAILERNTTDRVLASVCPCKPDMVRAIVSLLVLAYSHSTACCVATTVEETAGRIQQRHCSASSVAEGGIDTGPLRIVVRVTANGSADWRAEYHLAAVGVELEAGLLVIESGYRLRRKVGCVVEHSEAKKA